MWHWKCRRINQSVCRYQQTKLENVVKCWLIRGRLPFWLTFHPDNVFDLSFDKNFIWSQTASDGFLTQKNEITGRENEKIVIFLEFSLFVEEAFRSENMGVFPVRFLAAHCVEMQQHPSTFRNEISLFQNTEKKCEDDQIKNSDFF